MNLTDDLLPAAWYWSGLLALAVLLSRAARNAPWRRLTEPSFLNAWLGAIVGLSVLWTIRAGIQPGLAVHLLGGTVCTLMFGPHLALLAVSLVAVVAAFAGSIEPWSLPLNILLMGGVPIAVSLGVLRAAERWLPSHFFVYILAVAFFGAALSMAATGLTASALLATSGAYPLDYLRSDYLPWFLLMSWAEAFTSGALITVLVVYRPQWVATFDDERYLDGK